MSTQKNIQKLPADGLAGFRENFSKDALSGFLVFLLALPLSLGIAKASDFPAIFGLITAIIGGVVVSFFSGSLLTVKGPAAGLIVIASNAVAAFGGGETGWHLALGAVVVAGLLQVLFGVLKLGRLADFFPQAAIHGMLAAIGIIIISKQVHTMLGIDPSHIKGKEPLELLAMIPDSVMHENAHLAEIGFACLGLMALFSIIKHKKIKKIPAPLVVLLVAIPLGQILHVKTEGAISNFALVKIGNIADNFKQGFFNVDFSGMFNQTGVFIEYVVLFALIGSLESLLTAKAIDTLDPYKRKSNFNKDLMAVGIGNSLAGLLGGLPMISEVARSSANVANGARTRWANFFHGVFLLVAVFFAVNVIEMIPNAALAAMLIFVGYRLAHPREFAHVWQIGKGQFIIYLSTIIVTLATDLLIGVGTGILLEILINLMLGAPLRDFFRANFHLHKSNEGGYVLNVESALMFSNILGFKKLMTQVPAGKDVIINMGGATLVDHTALMTLNSIVDDYNEQGGNICIKGFDNHKTLGYTPTSVKKLNLD
jgi:MFS superfamily sulfate permease-like transporter